MSEELDREVKRLMTAHEVALRDLIGAAEKRGYARGLTDCTKDMEKLEEHVLTNLQTIFDGLELAMMRILRDDDGSKRISEAHSALDAAHTSIFEIIRYVSGDSPEETEEKHDGK